MQLATPTTLDPLVNNAKHSTIYTPNQPDAEHLVEVMAYMLQHGRPTINVVSYGDCYLALEGSHRLAACQYLGIMPLLNEYQTNDIINITGYDWYQNDPEHWAETLYPAGEVAGEVSFKASAGDISLTTIQHIVDGHEKLDDADGLVYRAMLKSKPQAEWANLLNRQQTYISQIANGKRPIPTPLVVLIADACGYNYSQSLTIKTEDDLARPGDVVNKMEAVKQLAEWAYSQYLAKYGDEIVIEVDGKDVEFYDDPHYRLANALRHAATTEQALMLTSRFIKTGTV